MNNNLDYILIGDFNFVENFKFDKISPTSNVNSQFGSSFMKKLKSASSTQLFQ